MKKLTNLIDKLSCGQKRRKNARILEKSMDKKSFTAKYSAYSMLPGLILSVGCIIISIACAFVDMGSLFYILLGITAGSITVTAMEMTYRVEVNPEVITEIMFIFRKKIPLESIGEIKEEITVLSPNNSSRNLTLIGKNGKKLLSLSDDLAGYEHIVKLVSKYIKTAEHIKPKQ